MPAREQSLIETLNQMAALCAGARQTVADFAREAPLDPETQIVIDLLVSQLDTLKTAIAVGVAYLQTHKGTP